MESFPFWPHAAAEAPPGCDQLQPVGQAGLDDGLPPVGDLAERLADEQQCHRTPAVPRRVVVHHEGLDMARDVMGGQVTGPEDMAREGAADRIEELAGMVEQPGEPPQVPRISRAGRVPPTTLPGCTPPALPR
jgi:hypothetical protein